MIQKQLAPERFEVRFTGDGLEYKERIDVGHLSDQERDDLERRAGMAFEGLSGGTVRPTFERAGDKLLVSYTVEDGDVIDALAVAATELLLTLQAEGGDPDVPWHLVKALGERPGDQPQPKGVRAVPDDE